MQTQHFFIEGKYLGSVPRDGRAHSHMFFCFQCGDVWARCPVDPPGPSSTNWVSHPVRCRKCGAGHTLTVDTPGSLWQEWPEPEFPAAFPDAVLQWEVQRQFEQLDKWKRVQS